MTTPVVRTHINITQLYLALSFASLMQQRLQTIFQVLLATWELFTKHITGVRQGLVARRLLIFDNCSSLILLSGIMTIVILSGTIVDGACNSTLLPNDV